MTQEQKHTSKLGTCGTPGAMRAARSIMVMYKFLDLPGTAERMAEAIDREMAAPDLSETVNRELLAALEIAQHAFRRMYEEARALLSEEQITRSVP